MKHNHKNPNEKHPLEVLEMIKRAPKEVRVRRRSCDCDKCGSLGKLESKVVQLEGVNKHHRIERHNKNRILNDIF